MIKQQKKCGAHLEDFHHHFLIVGHVYGLKYFAVLPSTQFTHQLIVVLIAGRVTTKDINLIVITNNKHQYSIRTLKQLVTYTKIIKQLG